SQLKEAKELMLELIKHGTLPVGWELLQAGYGRTRADNPDSAGNLNFKLSKFSNGRPATYYDTTAGENTSVLVLESSAAWTTLPGDSGGPLFAVNRVKGNTHVIGVTLGSDVFATLQAEQQGLAANDTDGAHNNAATALDRVYDGWDELGSMVGLPLVRDHFSL
ncbi:MAG TPA: hypothetical protein VFQ61_12290, partial [Polyangiaceae bacterium]|nr:hypothetical protein [Polyangiaceae bacterium]